MNLLFRNNRFLAGRAPHGFIRFSAQDSSTHLGLQELQRMNFFYISGRDLHEPTYLLYTAELWRTQEVII